MFKHEEIDDGRWYSKIHKTCLCPGCCLPCNPLFHPCRKSVSRSKRRYQENGFDLDLAYVDSRIIVHGFPAIGIEHIYRNPRFEIRRFMDQFHSDHYKVYNFCCEPGRGYSPDVYYGRVERYPFKDHNTPPLETMAAFGNSVKLWLDEDPENVVNMHCKAGKGRAGLMSCVAMIRLGIAQSAKEALEIYDRKRVTNNRGLTVTSQRKSVVFYEMLWRKFWNVSGNIGDIPAEPITPDGPKIWVVPPQPEIHLYGLEVLNFNEGTVSNVRAKVLKGTNFSPIFIQDSGKGAKGSTSVNLDCTIQGNFKIIVEQSTTLGSKKLFELLHNTLFMDRTAEFVDFEYDQLDIKKKVLAKLGKGIVVRVKMTPAESALVNPEDDGPDDIAGRGGNGTYEMVNVVSNEADAGQGSDSDEGSEVETDALAEKNQVDDENRV